MTYVKQTWANDEDGGTPISAARLNYIESGVESVDLSKLPFVENLVTGTTDNRSILEPLFTAIGVAGGGNLRLPAGTFTLTRKAAGSAYCLDAVSNLVISGEGIDRTILKLADSQLAFTSIIRVATDITNVTIMDMTFDGNAANQVLEVQEQRHCVNVDSGIQVKFIRCKFKNTRGDGVRVGGAALGLFASRIKFIDCEFEGNERNGITLGGTEEVLITGCRFASNIGDSAIDSEPTRAPNNNVTIVDNLIQGNNNYAITTKGTSNDDPSRNWIVTDNIILNGSVYIIQARKLQFARNLIIGANLANTPAIQMSGYTEDIDITDSYIESPVYRGIYAFPSTGTLDKIKVINNTIVAATSGLYILSTNTFIADNNIIIGNGTGTNFGILIQATTRDVERITLAKNTIMNFNSTGISLSRTGSWTNKKVSIKDNILDDNQGVATMTTGITTTLAAAVDSATFSVSGNVYGAAVTTPNNFQSGVYYAIAGGAAGSGAVAGTAARGIFSCTGTPEGTITAPIGSQALRRDGGAGTVFYVKESGVGNTGWVAK